jgi:hypothetical protein
MKIYKLLLGMLCTTVFIVVTPMLFAKLGWISPLLSKSWLALLITGGGLIIKFLVADLAGGEFLWHKYGYDNCILAFGSFLTSLVLQLNSDKDLFPGLSSVSPVSFSQFSGNPAGARQIQLFILFFISLLATLLTARLSAAIKEKNTPRKDVLAAINAVVGVLLLSVYVAILVSKG